MTSRPPRVESGRRRPITYPSAAGPAVVAAVVAVALVVVVGQRTRRSAPPGGTPSPAATSPEVQRTARAPVTTPTPTGTPTPAVDGELASPWVEATPPPTPTPPFIPTPVPAATRAPRPSPSIPECVRYGWSTLQVYEPPSAHVNVTIQVENHCGRELRPLELWFEVRGYRQGALVQVARGHPFDPVGTRFPGELTIGLPGSQDWYDRITVDIVEAR